MNGGWTYMDHLPDEPKLLIGQVIHPQFHPIFIFHPVLEHIELQHAHHAYDHFLHAGARNLEDLNGALLGNLLSALHKLLALHGVPGRDPGEMLRGKGGDAGKFEFLPGDGDGVANGEDARVKHADDVPGVGLLHDFPLGCHELLRLAQSHFFITLDVENLGLPLVFAGADPQESQPVPVGLVHVGLDLEDEGGKVRGKGVHQPAVRYPGGGGRGQAVTER